MSGRVHPSSRASSRRKISADKNVQRAALLYERFTGHEADEAVKINVPSTPREAVCIGDVDGILYTTIRDGKVEQYIHKFAKNDRPLFCVTSNGKQILFVGGRYTFTERGIVDKSDKSR